MVLSAVGILMVVDSHTWGTFDIFARFFPFNSFFMPMFVFISGYFNKVSNETDLPKYILKKFRTLLLPYWIISAVAIVIEWLILCYKSGSVEPFLFGYRAGAFLNTFTSGEITTIALPMWFAPMLFTVQAVYAVLKKYLYKIWNNKVFVVIFAACHIFSVWYAKGHELPEPLLLPFKVLFFLAFIEMGILYRDVLEEKLRKVDHLLVLSGLLMINMIRIMILPNEYDLAFDSLGTFDRFTSPYAVTPLISSIVGILFWLEVVDLIGKAFYNSKIVNAISENTFYIMSFHIIFFNLLNCLLFTINKFTEVRYFDEEAFRESNWYRWEYVPQFRYVYFLVGVLGPVGIMKLYDRFIRKPFKRKMSSTKKTSRRSQR